MLAADSPTVARLVAVLAGMPTAAPTLDEVIAETGWDGDGLNEVLEHADATGLVEPWDSPTGLRVALTALAAEVLGLRIVEDEEQGGLSCHWEPVGTPGPVVRPLPARKMIPASVAAGAEGGDYLDQFPDSAALEPFELVDFADRCSSTLEARERASRVATGGEPMFRPIHIAGLGRPWRTSGAEEVCSGCEGGPLSFFGYCSKCDRCGFDHLIGPPPRRSVRAGAERSKALAGGVGAAKGLKGAARARA